MATEYFTLKLSLVLDPLLWLLSIDEELRKDRDSVDPRENVEENEWLEWPLETFMEFLQQNTKGCMC